jgi:hypothetical protein
MFRCNLRHLQGAVAISIFETQSPFGSEMFATKHIIEVELTALVGK